jgi:hypothetical protein
MAEQQTVLPLAAVEAMLKDQDMKLIMLPVNRLRIAQRLVNAATNPPDWLQAAASCHNDDDVLPVAMHTYLMDWRPE